MKVPVLTRFTQKYLTLHQLTDILVWIAKILIIDMNILEEQTVRIAKELMCSLPAFKSTNNDQIRNLNLLKIAHKKSTMGY